MIRASQTSIRWSITDGGGVGGVVPALERRDDDRVHQVVDLLDLDHPTTVVTRMTRSRRTPRRLRRFRAAAPGGVTMRERVHHSDAASLGWWPTRARSDLPVTTRRTVPTPPRSSTELLRERILVLDGAMGTMIQGHQLDEADYRGERFAAYDRRPRGRQRPALADPARRHPRHPPAPTSTPAPTSSAPTPSTAPASPRPTTGSRTSAYELNVAAARARPRGRRRVPTADRPALRRRLARPDLEDRLDLARRQRPRRPQHHLRRARRGLPRGGARAWSTAAPTCCWSRPSSTPSTPRPRSSRSRRSSSEHGRRWPVMVSGTITDASGRTLSGQVDRGVLELRAPRPAARRRPQLRARRRRSCGPTSPSCRGSPTASSPPTPTPACPTRSASTTRRRTTWPRCSASSPTSGLVNIVGGCCGTTAEHIAAIADAAKGVAPRAAAGDRRRRCACPAWSRSPITDDSLFVNVGERTNITGSARVPQADQGRRLRRRA